MTITKLPLAAQASVSNAALATTTGPWVDLTGAYGASLKVLITNGPTGPTQGCTARVDLSPDNGATVYPGAGGAYLAGVAASASFATAFPLEADEMYARVVFAGNTGQAVTVQADVTKVTAQ